MKHQFALICVLFTTVFPLKSHAESPPDYLSGAITLWKQVSPESQRTVFDSIHFTPISGETAPLARYHPAQNNEDGDKEGDIEIGQNLRQYRRDYVYLVSNQDKIAQPDFDQYLTVLTTLSLANESAHYQQDKNGSLKDFYKFYNHGNTDEACAIYSLQQYVSDIVMIEKAIRIEHYFLGQGSIKGLNALYISLEKNDLRDEYEDFREALKFKDKAQLDSVLHIIRTKREDANMSSLQFCKDHGNATLDKTIIDRATAPAKEALQSYMVIRKSDSENQTRSIKKNYND